MGGMQSTETVTLTALEPIIFEKIIGGSETLPAEISFQAQIKYNRSHICGGVIIDALFLLTAAHCVFGSEPGNLEVVGGELDTLSSSGNEQVRRVERFVIHHGYWSSAQKIKEHDIAILKLSSPFQFNKWVNKVDFHENSYKYNGIATVSGWGQLHRNSGVSTVLRKANVPVIPETVCADEYNGGVVTNSIVCAGGDGKDACKGDSGGPLSAKVARTGETIVIGLVSQGELCGNDSKKIGIYTNISKYSKWIRNVIRAFQYSRCSTKDYFCPSGQLRKPVFKCLPDIWECDDQLDCINGEDEINCDREYGHCPKGSFFCESGQLFDNSLKCLPIQLKCNGVRHCQNGEDEIGCSSCAKTGYYCQSGVKNDANRKCIPIRNKCDNVNDCNGGEDEDFCEVKNITSLNT